MPILTILLIAFGLAMDCFAVAVASGIAIRKMHLGHAFKMAVFFGTFQAVMPIAGWLLGTGLRPLISEIDHWLAFLLLAFIGGKMIWEARQEEEFIEKKKLTTAILFFLAIATSIDALVVGLSLSFLEVSIWMPAVVIGSVAFLLSLSGVYIGKRVGHFCEVYIEILGGVILIGIGIKILIEHLFF